MSHGGSAVRTVPRVLDLPHVNQELLHLSDTQSSADHHLKMDTNKTSQENCFYILDYYKSQTLTLLPKYISFIFGFII